MKTPFPWLRFGRSLVGERNGKPDHKHPVAKFSNEEDAVTVAAFVQIRDEVLATLRINLKLLDEELANRKFSGVPDYIKPVDTAVDRTKQAISTMERWP
jgi:hypothetical protein